MTHPIIELQRALVTALLADAALTTALGGAAIFDAPSRGSSVPHVAIIRHDILPRDGDEAPGFDHRLLVHCRTDQPSRRAVLDIAERVIAVALTADLSTAGLVVTHAQHDRTDTAIEAETGDARAAIALRFLTEPG